MASSHHGSAILFETICAAEDAWGDAGKELASVIDSLAASATTEVRDVGVATSGTLMTHPIAARLLKRLVQKKPAFAKALHTRVRGALMAWVKRGSAWIVLALLESSATSDEVRFHLVNVLISCRQIARAAAPQQDSFARCRSRKN